MNIRKRNRLDCEPSPIEEYCALYDDFLTESSMFAAAKTDDDRQTCAERINILLDLYLELEVV